MAAARLAPSTGITPRFSRFPRFTLLATILILTAVSIPIAANTAFAKASFIHPTAFIPIMQVPTEDVDFVPATVSNPVYPEMGIWPVEGMVHFFDMSPGPPALIASIPTASPNITGVDFLTDGTWGVFQTLGFGYIYNMNGAGSLPTLTSTIALPGAVPNRRDIDPFIIPDAAAPAGVSAVYTTGLGVHCRAIPTGAVRWDVTLPTPIVEAVDPVYSSSGKIYVPCEGFMVVINAVTGGVLSSSALGSSLVREVDVKLTGPAAGGPGPAYAWLPTASTLWVFDDAPGSLGLPVTSFPLGSSLIEGNDFEIDPSGSLGYLPTLAFMYQVNLVVPGFSATWPLTGFVHQRNQDVIFTPPSCGACASPMWAYAMQGVMLIGQNVLAAPAPTVLGSPGTLVDGVDPSFSDSPPFGAILSVPTLASTNVYNAAAVSYLGSIPRTPGSGTLRVDVDHKPAPMPGNYLTQPAIGGLTSVTGFGPNDWVVTTSLGLEIIDIVGMAVVEYIPYAGVGGGLTFRGGDGQPTFMAGAGPLEPAFSVDQPDQDFVTKCWEYKYATNRWPYWYSRSMPAFYPQYVPYGVFGPPAQAGYDLLNNDKVVLLSSNQVAILNEHGNVIYTFPLPAPAIGGFVFDQDNKICKIRCRTQLEVIIDLSTIPYSGVPTIHFANYGSYIRWYPIVDRMNGWEFAVQRGGTQLWIYNHLNSSLVSVVSLPARCIRAPLFDEQRKTLCMPLANRTVCYFNAHNYRVGLPASQYLYSSAVLPAHIAAAPVFDIYNHYTVCQLQDTRIVVLNNVNALTVWDSGILPYRPVCPLQIDCYNKVGKGFYRDASFNYYEMRLNLYPLVYGGPATYSWIALTAQPYGYPLFYSRGGYELCRLGTNTIEARSIFNPASVITLSTPFGMTGSLMLDRVNGYVLAALQGNRLFWIDLYRLTRGLPVAAKTITLSASANTNDDIVFATQTIEAMGSLSDGSMYLIDLKNGTQISTPSFSSLPPVNRQLYIHPFRCIVNEPWWTPSGGGETTIDLAPTRWSGGFSPQINIVSTPSPPIDACDTIPPNPPTPGVPTLPVPTDAIGVVHYKVASLEPGSTLYAYKPSALDFEPTYGTADDDGICDDISILASNGEQVCFMSIDPSGNASSPTCVVVQTTDVPGEGAEQLAFTLESRNPTRDAAHFALTLPVAGPVSLRIYDVSGRLVRTIEDGPMTAGKHSLTWNVMDGARRSRPGVYLARLKAAGKEVSLRVVVIQ